MLPVRSGILAALACLLLSLSGCGGGSGEATQAADPAEELAAWFRSVEAAVTRMEQKQRGFTHFHVAEPPSKNDLVELSPAGTRAGETAAGAAEELDSATALTGAEAAGLYCYFFAFYVELESSPDKGEFELVIDNLVKASLEPSASPTEVRESADALRKAMIEAEKGLGPSPEVAAAVFC